MLLPDFLPTCSKAWQMVNSDRRGKKSEAGAPGGCEFQVAAGDDNMGSFRPSSDQQFGCFLN